MLSGTVTFLLLPNIQAGQQPDRGWADAAQRIAEPGLRGDRQYGRATPDGLDDRPGGGFRGEVAPPVCGVRLLAGPCLLLGRKTGIHSVFSDVRVDESRAHGGNGDALVG